MKLVRFRFLCCLLTLLCLCAGCDNATTPQNQYPPEKITPDKITTEEADSYTPSAMEQDEVEAYAASMQTAAVSGNELELTEQRCAKIAKTYRDLYRNAEKTTSVYMPGQEVLTQQALDKIEAHLAAAGYAVIDTDEKYPAYLQNAKGLQAFWQAVQQGKTAEQVIVWLLPNGDFVYTCLTNNSEGGAILEASGHWNEKNTLEVMDLNKQEVLDWTLTDSNKFYYKIMETYAPTIEHYTMIRLMPVDKQLYDQTAAYILPVGYDRTNLFLCDWNSKNYGKLSLNDVLEYLYLHDTGEYLDASQFAYNSEPYYSKIPAQLFEGIILPHFDISQAELRQLAHYDKASNTYPWQEQGGSNISYFPTITPEVTACHQNKDGTITLTVNAMCTEFKTDCLFTHEVTIRPGTNGGFQYLGNRITYRSDEQQPSSNARLDSGR